MDGSMDGQMSKWILLYRTSSLTILNRQAEKEQRKGGPRNGQDQGKEDQEGQIDDSHHYENTTNLSHFCIIIVFGSGVDVSCCSYAIDRVLVVDMRTR